MNLTDEFCHIPPTSRPKIRWWLPSTFTDPQELEREIMMLKEAGFSGAEIAASFACDSVTQNHEKGWGAERWGELIKRILQMARSRASKLT